MTNFDKHIKKWKNDEFRQTHKEVEGSIQALSEVLGEASKTALSILFFTRRFSNYVRRFSLSRLTEATKARWWLVSVKF